MGSEAINKLRRDAVPGAATELHGPASARETGARCHVWGRAAAAGARSALKARRRLERQHGPGGRRDAAAAPATCAAGGEASGWFWPRRCCTVTAARLWLYSPRRASGSRLPRRADGRVVPGCSGAAGLSCSGAGWLPRAEARWALCFPSVPARRVPEEAVQGAGQELQPAGEAGGQRLAAAHRVLLPESPADHGCGESGAALGLRTFLSWTRLRFEQTPSHLCMGTWVESFFQLQTPN